MDAPTYNDGGVFNAAAGDPSDGAGGRGPKAPPQRAPGPAASEPSSPIAPRPATSEPTGAAADAEAALLAALVAGQPAAAQALVRANTGWMLAVARRYVKDAALAEDCVQDAFMRAFLNIKRFEARASLRAWLHRIVVNAALMTLRARKRLDDRDVDELLRCMDEGGVRLDQPWAEVRTADSILESQELCALVRATIATMPPSCRVVLMMRDIEQRSTAETAAALGLTEGAVKVRLHRARAALRRRLAPLLPRS